MDGLKIENRLNGEGRPAGGSVRGVGIAIDWQDGPLGRVGTNARQEPNGAFVEQVLEAALQRLVFYQEAAGGRFQCEENAAAIASLQDALGSLDARTRRRVEAATEGTHEGA